MSNPGIRPLEYKVIILPDPVEKKTAGGIILTDESLDKEQNAAVRATFVEASPLAFNYDGFPKELRPKPGDRVIIARYTGATFEGEDGKQYRILNDKDIIGVET